MWLHCESAEFGLPGKMIGGNIIRSLIGLARKPGPKTRALVLEATRSLLLSREMVTEYLPHCLLFFTVESIARPASMSLAFSFPSGHRAIDIPGSV